MSLQDSATVGSLWFSVTEFCLLVCGICVHDHSLLASLVQLLGSVNDYEADLRKAGIKAR